VQLGCRELADFSISSGSKKHARRHGVTLLSIPDITSPSETKGLDDALEHSAQAT
jgi:hypothetical protein